MPELRQRPNDQPLPHDGQVGQGTITLFNDTYSAILLELESLRAQLAAQQAVVDAARAFDAVLSDYCDGPERDQLRAALNTVQAAQPEGERETNQRKDQ